jgi:glyoxylase-like metal-dependent hydrolase (beta-lactamase superfamily II)
MSVSSDDNGTEASPQDATEMSDNSTAMLEAAPLPAISGGVEIPEAGYFVEEISDGLYWVTDGTYTTMFLTTGEGVIVVDAPPSTGENLLAAIASVTSEPITHVIYSHSHADHIASAGLYPEEATYIAHASTATQLERMDDPTRAAPYGMFVGGGPVPPPTVTFDDTYTLEVGNQTLELEYQGPGHEPGNVFIWAPQQKVLMLVDVIFPGWVPFKDLAVAEDVPAFIAAHQQALDYEFESLVAGHLNRLGTREDVETQIAYVTDLQESASQALQSVDFGAIAAQTGVDNAWLLFDTYLDAVAADCAERVESEWVGKLGGADVFTESHCAQMAESLRID